MDKLKVILIQDGSSETAASPDPVTLPGGIEVVGSLKLNGFSGRRSPFPGLQAPYGESAVSLVEHGFGEAKPGRVSPSSAECEIQERPITLTRTELEVLRLLAKGAQNKEIASDMYISVNTVKSHVSSILRKLRVRNRAQAVRYVYKCGMWQ